MDKDELQKKKAVYVKSCHEKLDELCKDPRECVAMWQEIYTPELLAVFELHDRMRVWPP